MPFSDKLSSGACYEILKCRNNSWGICGYVIYNLQNKTTFSQNFTLAFVHPPISTQSYEIGVVMFKIELYLKLRASLARFAAFVEHVE